jgi:hypothetical protein
MSENIKELCAAMAKAFGEIRGAVKDKKNAHLNYEYASLNSFIEAIRPAIIQHGLWFYQVIHAVQGCAAVETLIMHSSGESLSCGVVTVPVQKQDAQGYGSALTYARKYSLSSAFGVAPEDDDDDGEKACAPPRKVVEEVKKPIPEEVKKPIPKDILVRILRERTGIKDKEFDEYLEKMESFFTEKNMSFTDELKRCSEDPETTIERFNAWKAKRSMKTTVDKPVAA